MTVRIETTKLEAGTDHTYPINTSQGLLISQSASNTISNHNLHLLNQISCKTLSSDITEQLDLIVSLIYLVISIDPSVI